MGVGLPPLEFTECLSDSPKFRDNLHKHEKELENTNQQIKRLIKEVKDLLNASKQLSNSQRSFAKSLQSFSFDCIGGTQTDDERVICKSLNEFGKLISSIEDERDRMLENAYNQVVNPLETFRKSHIGGVKAGKKKFDKQTAKFCQCQERYLNLTTKKQNDTALKEADASVGMAERHFYNASMDYVYLIQEVQERKKFDFVETLLGFMIGWLTFYHQGYEVAKDFSPYKKDLTLSLQKTRENFEDYRLKLRKRMAEIQKQVDPVRNIKGRKEGYLFLLEKKAFGNTWTKHFCTYDKENKEFSMIPYNQIATKSVPQPEIMVLSSCVRRMSDSIDKRFCFDLQVDSRPGLIHTFQALNETDRKAWMDIMDGKEPTYTNPNPSVKIQNAEERILDEIGLQFVKKCIEVLESRSLEEQGLYRVVGVTSKVSKLLTMGLDRRKSDKLINLDDPQEWETKTITSALKSYLRNLPEPLMTHRFHNGFIAAVKSDSRQQRIHDVHTLIYRIPKPNFDVLKILMKHLSNVAERCDKNLMTVSNLGVCFGPTLLRPEEETVASIVDLKFYNIVVEILIGNYEKIFNSEPENLQIIRNISPPQTVNFTNNGGHMSPIEQPSPMNYTDSEYANNLKSYGTTTNHTPSNSRISYNQPIMCTMRTSYYDPNAGNNMSSSLYNVHESPPNGGNMYTNMSKSEHVPVNGAPAMPHHKLIQRFNNSTISSQSESNIPNLQSYSPTHFQSYGRLENSTSSSNESVSSNSRDGGTTSYLNNLQHLPPEKSNRSNLGVSYPKGYKSQGAMTLRKGTNSSSTVGTAHSGRSSPSVSGLRRVRTLYACLGENDGELSFEPNQIITNVKSSQEPGWLEGTLNGKTGLIPENYVEMLP